MRAGDSIFQEYVVLCDSHEEWLAFVPALLAAEPGILWNSGSGLYDYKPQYPRGGIFIGFLWDGSGLRYDGDRRIQALGQKRLICLAAATALLDAKLRERNGAS